jgi:dTDP-glucose pyrophosphorylase
MIPHHFTNNIILNNSSILDAMKTINKLEGKETMTLFVINQNKIMLGTLTDGDIRRGLLAGKNIDECIESFMNKNFNYLKINNYKLEDIDKLRQLKIDLVPVLNSNNEIIKIVSLYEKKSIIPVDAFIMAGGEGKRLRPLTDQIPKPMLKVGDKPIIEHNIDRLKSYGIDNICISVNYLAHKIQTYFSDGSNRELSITYVKEPFPLGTIGSLALNEKFLQDTILVMNSDLLTDIDFEDFYRSFIKSNADMAVAGVPYKVNIPYAVMELKEEQIISFKEKPTYVFYSNAGIYLIKKEHISKIPKNIFYNATDLMENIINQGLSLIYYPIHGYWLDIGQHEEYKKAQEDIKHIKF